jgi:preprotein translocase subunit YajC
MTKQFKVGDKVVDRDGFTGTVIKVTDFDGSHWYDVRIWDGTRRVGEAVRYESDLSRA